MLRIHPRFFLITLAAMAALLAAPAGQAQLELDITGGFERPSPIAVVPFQVAGEGAGPEEDISRIIADNLRRTGKFDPIPSRDLIAQPATIDQVRFQQWQALGIDNLVIGRIEPAGNSTYRVRFELLDVYRGVRLEGSRFTNVGEDVIRDLAHTISDLVYEAITGIEGAFSTEIAYVTVDEENDRRVHRLWVADADGARPHTYLMSPQPIMSPAWAPDRSRLAYVSFEDNERSAIWIMEVPSAERRKVASFRGINSAPAWAPDGRRLALTLSRDGDPNLYVLDTESGDLTRLTQTAAIDTEAVWAPDGRHIYFTSDRGGRAQIYRVPSGGGRAERVTFDGVYNARPDISPDGRMLAMVHRDDAGFRIAVMDLETGRTRPITAGGMDEAPSFAPNGEMIVYSRTRGGRSELATVSLHGNVTTSLPLDATRIRSAAWSPR